MELIKNKLIASNFIDNKFTIDIDILKKFNEVDYKEAKEDVMPFIKNIDSLNMWNKEFFIEIMQNME